MSGAVTVTGGTPTLTLNDGGTATYVSGTGTNALTFSYTVGAGQNIAVAGCDGVNRNVTDGAGIAPATPPCSLTGLPAAPDRHHGTGHLLDC